MLRDLISMPPYIERMLGEMERGLEQGEVPLSIYGDPEIYALELERIFGRCWMFLAHESEIPNPGDYVQRSVADTTFIVTRDASGKVHALFDSCRHRGSKLCPADRGNTSHFRCPYHGWTYRSDGALVGVPNRSDAYQQMDEADWSLLRARVSSYHGLIFACLDDETESLEDFLGDFRWYLDVHLDLAPEGLEVAGSPLRWVLPGNWKSAAENFAGDSYHTQWLHRSVGASGMIPGTTKTPYNVHVTECSGHATSIARVGPDEVCYWGNGPAFERYYRESRLSPAQRDLARRSMTSQGTIFPNFSIARSGSTDDANKPSMGFFSFALWQPKSPTTTEVWRWALVPKGASDAEKLRSYTVAVAHFGPAGNFEQDDTVVWGGTSRAGSSLLARKAKAKLNYTMGLPGMSAAKMIPDWPGPGVIYDDRLEDGVQRTILRHWLARMSAE